MRLAFVLIPLKFILLLYCFCYSFFSLSFSVANIFSMFLFATYLTEHNAQHTRVSVANIFFSHVFMQINIFSNRYVPIDPSPHILLKPNVFYLKKKSCCFCCCLHVWVGLVWFVGCLLNLLMLCLPPHKRGHVGLRPFFRFNKIQKLAK